MKYKFYKNLNNLDKKRVAKNALEILKDSWGDWGLDYVESHIINSDFLTLASYKGEIVAFASCKKIKYQKEIIYYLEFTAIKKAHQGKGLSVKLNKMIMNEILLENLKRFKFCFQVITISPNPRVLGMISRSAKYTFPSPMEGENAPIDIWDKVQFVIKKLNDPYNSLSREGCVVQGFYDDKPNLIYDPKKVPQDSDNQINRFANRLLKYDEKRGCEFVIYAKYCLSSFIKNVINVK